MKKRSLKDMLMTAVDVMFVLILCFAILLTTMLLTRSDGGEAFTGYSINIPVLAGVIISVALYLVFMRKVSIGMLRDIISGFFKKHETSEKEGK